MTVGMIMRRFAWALCLGAVLAASGALAAAASATTPGAAAWGEGSEGLLGNGGNHNQSLFAPLSVLSEPVKMAGGGDFALALRSNGTVMAWGSNKAGQLGLGKGGGESKVPVTVPGLSEVTAISACGEEALAVKGGKVLYWGSSENGVPGGSSPTVMPGISEAVAVAAGCEDRKVAENQVTNLALLANGHVLAWGNGEDGQLGNGESGKGVKSETPVEVLGISEATSLAAGNGQNFAVLSGGTLKAWGENNAGQLGIGNSKNQDEAVTVSGLSGVVAAAAGDQNSMALLSGGTVEAWGDNSEGVLGRPEIEGGSNVPISIAGLSHVTAIGTGARFSGGLNTEHAIALIEGGTVKTWGSGKYGMLGNGEEGGASSTPTTVEGLTGVTSISAGAHANYAGGPAVPIVTSISPTQGPAKGGTKVTVHGFNLGEASKAEFGSSVTTTIEEDTAESLVAVSPEHKPQKISVTVTTPFHTSGITSPASFLYTAGESLVFGRCLNVGKKAGNYKKGCTELAEGGGFEWSPEIPKPGFTLTSAAPQELASAEGTLAVCTEVGTGSGEFTGGRSVTNVTLTFKGCGLGKLKSATKCNSPGAAEGEIVTSTLEGTVGFTSKIENSAAIELLPPEGSLFMQFTCGTTSTEVRGAVFGAITPVNSSNTTFKLKFSQTKGKQKIVKFEEGPTEVLEASVGGAAFEQAGLDDTVTLTSEEAVELNSVI